MLALKETYLNTIALQIESIGAMIMKRETERTADCKVHPLIKGEGRSYESLQNREKFGSCMSSPKMSRIPEKESIGNLLLPVKSLERAVWEKGACSSCMSCISVCPSGSLAYDRERNRPYQVASCVDCRACLDVCPRIPANNKQIYSSPILGPCLAIKNARFKGNGNRSQRGGAVTALLTAALDEELADCALVMDQDPWSQKAYPRAVFDSRDLKNCAGSKYTNNAILEPLGELAKSAKNIILVGTACSADAIGLMRISSNEFAKKIARKVRFVIGLFCFEAYDESLIEGIVEITGIPAWRFCGMDNAEGKMVIRLRGGGSETIPLHCLAEHVKVGCKVCADFTAKLSDISVGNMGSATGMNAVIVRSAEGMGLLSIAEETGLIEISDGVDVPAIEKAGRLKLTKNSIMRSYVFGRLQ
jgi:coenzyme F420 hydrogenase subunit beta